jgi:hypothetical protein
VQLAAEFANCVGNLLPNKYRAMEPSGHARVGKKCENEQLRPTQGNKTAAVLSKITAVLCWAKLPLCWAKLPLCWANQPLCWQNYS